MNSYYPIQDYGSLMKGMVIGGLGIFHVFLAQMAIGGGMLFKIQEWLDQAGARPGVELMGQGSVSATDGQAAR
jgi:cytochrome d ubiquinol oxidase subunit I